MNTMEIGIIYKTIFVYTQMAIFLQKKIYLNSYTVDLSGDLLIHKISDDFSVYWKFFN